MIIAIASDHAGFALKKIVIDSLKEQKYKIIDLGCHNTKPSDYPDFAEKIGLALRAKKATRGVLICGSGVGASVAANKIPGIRAGLCHDTYSAHQGVEDDNMNVIVLGGRVVGIALARELVNTFLKAKYKKLDRYERRLQKVRSLEVRYGNSNTKN